MSDPWVRNMYLSSVAGSIAGIFYPSLVALFKGTKVFLDATIKAILTHNDLTASSSSTELIAGLLLLAFLGTAIGIVVTAIGFAAYMGSTENQTKLRALGALAYFSAVTFGFAAGLGFETALST